MACHNLCKNTKAPIGIERLLGLGAKYCVKKTKLTNEPLNKMMERMRESIRWKYIYRNQPDEEEERYIPQLHINTDLKPRPASSRIEGCMDDFERAIAIARRRYRQKDIIPNLMPDEEAMLRRMKKHKFPKIISADKNCGFVLIKTDHLTE